LAEIRNPNLQTQGSGGSGGGNSPSTMIFWVFLILVFLGWQFFFNKPQPQPPAPAQTAQQSTQPAAQPAVQSSAAGAQSEAVAAQAGTPQITSAAETTTTVENELYRIVLTNRGGQVQHWVLKKYFGTDGKPLDLVQPQTAQFGLPLSLYTYDSNLTQQLNSALYQVTLENGGGSVGSTVLAPATLVFHYAANGLDVVKSIHFDSKYLLTIDSDVKRNGSEVRALVEWPAGLGDMEEFLPNSSTRSQVRTSATSQFIWLVNGKQETVTAKKVSGNMTSDAPFSYAGISDLYFTATFLPEQPAHATVVSLHNTIDLPGDLSDPNSKKTPADVIGLAVGDTSGPTHVVLYAGPKSTEVLESIHAATGESLQPLIQYGWFSVIAKPLYYVLRSLKNALGSGAYNWGWAIIIVTLIFNLAMLPTRFMMMRSSLKMMRIQPKVDAIKNKYSNLKMNDPKRTEMNTEMMALYKQEGVNMYGSCLPMLVQIPLFLAYYRVLGNAIELRQAQWFWLHDLSMPDPHYVLPVLIILSMFLVQYITPSPGMDPAQRRMMAFMMPAIFGFTMLHFASGLALYWATGNIINLALQIGINQSHWGKEMHAIAARRAAKKTGGAKVIQGRR
jgi:YidC/Oxa1 family membrane protein insertase